VRHPRITFCPHQRADYRSGRGGHLGRRRRIVSNGVDDDNARVADEARRRASEEEGRARAEADRVAAEADRVVAEVLTGEAKEEGLRQLGVIYGGLIGVAVVMVQPFLAATTLDTSARVSVIAFAVAIPLLAALVLVNRQETFRGRRSVSVLVVVAQSVAQLAALIGIVAGFWHITWVAGVAFLVASLVAVGVHSAGYWRVETRDAES
jgi:tetrahydromethanopterin S-methyltransferase subunit G